jgi:hypothetical protein
MRRTRSRLATAATLTAIFAAWHFTGGLHGTAIQVQLPPGTVTDTAAVTATSQCQPLPAAATPAPSASPTAAAAGTPQLCVSVQAAEPDITTGKTATWTVQAWTQNGAAHEVTLTLTAAPGGPQPRFTSSCPSGNGTSSCSIGDIGTAVTPASYQLQAQVTAPAGAKALTLTAEAGSTPAMTTPPAAGQSIAVTGTSTTATPAASRTPAARTTTPPAATQPAQPTQPGTVPTAAISTLPALPSLTATAPASTATVPAGSVASVLPQVTPASIDSSAAANVQAIPAPATSTPAAAGSFTFSVGMSGKTAVTLAIILLALIVTLTCTRLIATEMGRTRPPSARHRGAPADNRTRFTIPGLKHPRHYLAGWKARRRRDGQPALQPTPPSSDEDPANSAKPGRGTGSRPANLH